jgi:hypothetical protein
MKITVVTLSTHLTGHRALNLTDRQKSSEYSSTAMERIRSFPILTMSDRQVVRVRYQLMLESFSP